MRWRGFRKVRRQVCRRLSRRLDELSLEDLEAYRRVLEADPGEWRVLASLCRITISRFYRDRAVFECLVRSGLPALADRVRSRGQRTIRCWSAGCASGEEPYSLVLAWALDASTRSPDTMLHVVATDIDDHLLARAERGCYPAATLRELPREWIEEAFVPAGGEHCLRPAYRGPVELLQQDIREDMPIGPFELVLCRNLAFTYFEASLQQEILHRILGRLEPGALLVVGGHEQLPPGDWPMDRPYGMLPVYRVAPASPG